MPQGRTLGRKGHGGEITHLVHREWGRTAYGRRCGIVFPPHSVRHRQRARQLPGVLGEQTYIRESQCRRFPCKYGCLGHVIRKDIRKREEHILCVVRRSILFRFQAAVVDTKLQLVTAGCPGNVVGNIELLLDITCHVA